MLCPLLRLVSTSGFEVNHSIHAYISKKTKSYGLAGGSPKIYRPKFADNPKFDPFR